MAKKNKRQNFGSIVQEARISKGLSQTQLAAKAGLTQQLVNAIESKGGNSTRFHNVIKVCRALGLSLDEAAKKMPVPK